MLKYFKSNNIIVQTIVVLAITGLMWAPSFAHPRTSPVAGGGSLFYWLTGALSPTLSNVIAIVLMLAEGVLLTSILYRHKLIGQGSLLPLLFYVIAMSAGRPALTPVLLGSLFLLLATRQLLLTSTLLSIGLDKTFGAAACVGLATIICPTLMVFLIPLVISMFNYSLYSWRDWAMLVLGFLAPWIPIETYYWIVDELFYRNYLLLYTLTDFHLNVGGTAMQWAVSVVFLLLLLCGILRVIGMSRNRSINFNKNIATLLLFTIGSVALAGYNGLFPVATADYAIPLAGCITYLFIEVGSSGMGRQSSNLWYNILFIVLILFFALSNWYMPLA